MKTELPQIRAVSSSLPEQLVDIFLGLSWAFEKYTNRVTDSPKTEKRKIFFAPLDTSLGLVSADPIRDPRVTTYLLCTQILRSIGTYHSDALSPLFALREVFDESLQSFVTDKSLNDNCVVVRELLAQFPSFYVPDCSGQQQYWKIEAKKYAFRAGRSFVARREWNLLLARLLFEKHVLLQKRDPKLNGGIVSVSV